jgi:Fic family protein
VDADGGDGEGFFVKQINLYRLQRYSDDLVNTVATSKSKFVVSDDLVKSLHRIAMARLLPSAGNFRETAVTLRGSQHVPPNYIEVPAHMQGFCTYLNSNWENRDLVHLAAFCMWRLNWIHPFLNGNGRTTRALSYLILCMKHGQLLPAKNSVATQIVTKKQDYNSALGYADQVYAASQNVDLALVPMEHFISAMLVEQLKANT